ncbi:hypothetical protein L9F63_007350 [Diploptera punctata]|uniref:Ionotropic glutamate receptor C-terminal domain-containing protein n=1 Tax=Diploptera punctata TaxID=6984 RepID=A0AAD7Z836_DIPPU|nr:hypothetical protein L9F63_007350 [Diploptera punctata]
MYNILSTDINTAYAVYKISFPYIYSTLRWYVPCPKQTVRHGNFYKVFAPGVWVLFFTSCILMALITVLLHKREKHFNNLSYSLCYIWAVVTSVSVPRMPTTTNLRTIFCMCVFYCLIISTIFQCLFTSFLIEPGTEEQIDTIEEIINHDLKLFGDIEVLYILFHFSEFIHGYSNELENKYVMSKSPIEDFFAQERSAVIASDLEMNLISPGNSSSMKQCSFYFSDDYYSRYFVQFAGHSPYYEAFNSKVLQFHETGLFTKEIDDYISNKPQSTLNMSIIVSKFKKENTAKYFVLNLNHMKVVLIIYLWGNMFSVLVFTAEVLSKCNNFISRILRKCFLIK